jgi:hypothetical protein
MTSSSIDNYPVATSFGVSTGPTITTSEGLAKMVENTAALNDAIIKAYCSAEAARAEYWMRNGSEDAKIFYGPVCAFWRSLTGCRAQIDYNTFMQYKKMWDNKATSTFNDTVVLELYFFTPQ